MSKYQDKDRANKISFAMYLVQKICEQAEIGIVPYKRKDGTLMVVIEDARNGKQYALIKNKEV